MKLFLFASDLLGFTALSISAALAASVSSLLRSILKYFLRSARWIISRCRGLRQKMQSPVTRARKNDTSWLVIKIWRLSFLVGIKDVSKPDSSASAKID